LILGLLAACGKEEAKVPDPVPISSDAIAHFCGMAVAEHPGPKGQAWLKGQNKPLWFAQVRDAVAFTLLPEEPKSVQVIWVNDMGKSKSWEQPDAWVDAKKAHYVIGSSRTGGMDLPEAVPFSEEAAAKAFAGQYGGRVVTLSEIPSDYVLETSMPPPPEGQTHGH
jgi:copper chaperone NosL